MSRQLNQTCQSKSQKPLKSRRMAPSLVRYEVTGGIAIERSDGKPFEPRNRRHAVQLRQIWQQTAVAMAPTAQSSNGWRGHCTEATKN